MRLGATLGASGWQTDPEACAERCRQLGFRAMTCSPVGVGETEKIRAIREAAARADVRIAEVGVWVNALGPRPVERAGNQKTIAEALAVADELAAACCVTVVGSFDPDHLVGPHPDNFSDETFDAVVEWVRRLLQQVKPRQTKLALEMSAWTLLEGPEVYCRLIEAIDHPGLAVHLDPTNAVRDAHLYYTTTDLLNRSFDLLGERIVSCHAKDIRQGPDPRTVSMFEVMPGRGTLDYRTYLTRIERLSPDMPLIIEHLDTEAEYAEAADYIRRVAREVGVTA